MNEPELAFAVWAATEGWIATKRGWPDFICYRGDEVMAVEVKWSDGLSMDQQRACLMLATHGIPTFVWSPPGPLEPFEVVGDRHVSFGDAQETYSLAREVERLSVENRRLRQQLSDVRMDAANRVSASRAATEAMRSDLGYLIRRVEWDKDRPNRLRAILRRYADLTLGVRPGLRVRRSSMSVSMSDPDEGVA
jgi:hypothetical protein